MKQWDNSCTELQPWRVAAQFAISNLSGRLLDVAIPALDLFSSGDVKGCKKLLDEVTLDEFDRGSDYLCWAQFKALFAKSSLPGDEKVRKDVAWKKFLAAEDSCKRVNRRLRYYGARPERENPIYRVVLSRARELISRTLGNFSEDTLLQILDFSRPGGGTAIGTKHHDRVTAPFKLGQDTRLVCTPRCLPYAKLLVEGSPAWFRLHAEIDWSSRTYRLPYETTTSNRIAFVPKDASTMRTIAVEPHLNLCLQLGTCEYLCRRLRGVGVDLADQTRNQQLARKGAALWQSDDPLATLDLSAASDSISVALVERLLPYAWREFLDDIRSPCYSHGGETVEYQKWSSMGNGTTFPLESLIFWALARACSSLVLSADSNPSISIYGDDIIVPRSVAALLIEVLRYVGFRVNTDKSFVFGPFRESCGEDWWGDERVVPVYLRYMERLRPTDVFRVINLLEKRFLTEPVSGLLLGAVGNRVLYGPKSDDATGCIWLHEAVLRQTPEIKWHRDYQRWTYLKATFKPLKRRCGEREGLAAALLGDLRVTDAKWSRSTLRSRGQWTLVRCVFG